MIRPFLIRLLTAFAIAIFFSACGAEAPAEAEAPANPEPTPVNVSVLKLEPKTLKDEVKLAGRLEPWVEVKVSTELGGTVQEIGFDKGQNVAKDQILARIGTDLLEASLDEAEAELQHAESEFNKTTELFKRQAVPRQDLTSATSNYRRAQARVAQARLRVERSIIRAPVSGVALTREIEMGEVVSAGSLVTTVHQLGKLKAVVGIPEDDIAYFKVGAQAGVEVDAYPERAFQGRIHFLSPAATGANRTFPAEVELKNRGGELRPGMIVRVHLVKQIYEDLIVIPRDAVVERDNGNVAFVLVDDRAVLRDVETGPSEQGEIVVLEGLAPGENLIVTGHRNLIDGQRVRSVNDSL